MLAIMGFESSMLRWCSLHSLNLGPIIWACGGAFELLLQEAVAMEKIIGFGCDGSRLLVI